MSTDSENPTPTPRRPRLPPAPPEKDTPAKAQGAAGPDATRAYTRYRAGRRALPERKQQDAGGTAPPRRRLNLPSGAYGGSRHADSQGDGSGGGDTPGSSLLGGSLPGGRLRRFTRRRVILGLIALLVGWLLLSLALFLLSATFNRTSPPANVKAVLDPGGYPLTTASNILVLGSDARQKNSREPGADPGGPSRSDTIMLIRTGDGHAARLSIPRDTVVNIPGHGLQKINAAYAFGGPALSISVIKSYLGIPINHLVEVNFENFPQLIDAMGGVSYTGGCIVSRLDGGFSRGGYTLRLPKGTHHLNGKQALALARTRENLCAPNENDIQRAEHQQALFQDMKSRLLSPSSFIRLPLIAWNTPPAIISDMSGPTLLGLFGALATSGTPPTRVLKPSSYVTLPGGSDALSVSESERRSEVAKFMAG
jgi:LCP family protein required for cell wall assembly